MGTYADNLPAAEEWPWSGLMVRIVSALDEPQRLADVVERLRRPADRAQLSDWESNARLAEVYSLLRTTSEGGDLWLRRTAFGDLWTSRLGSDDSWPMPGPGAFELMFYPLTQRPTFPVFALTGAAVAVTRQGVWSMKHGFGRAQPNPVNWVAMLSTLTDGTEVYVQSLKDDWYALTALNMTDHDRKDFLSINDQLMAALAVAAPPWQARTIDVDGSTHQILVLDLDSSELPTGVIGPPLLAIGTIDQVQISVICHNPDIDLAFTRVPIDDLIPPSNSSTQPNQTG